MQRSWLRNRPRQPPGWLRNRPQQPLAAGRTGGCEAGGRRPAQQRPRRRRVWLLFSSHQWALHSPDMRFGCTDDGTPHFVNQQGMHLFNSSLDGKIHDTWYFAQRHKHISHGRVFSHAYILSPSQLLPVGTQIWQVPGWSIQAKVGPAWRSKEMSVVLDCGN